MFALIGWLIEKAFLAFLGLVVIIVLIIGIAAVVGQHGGEPACAHTDSCAAKTTTTDRPR